MLGTVSALIFMVCGAFIFVNNINESVKILASQKSLLLIPIFAMFSSIWADYPILALRGGVQLLLTTVFSILLIVRVNKEIVLYCLGISLLIAMLASFFSSRMALNGITGEYSLIGIFNSKNYLATHTALAVGIGLAICFHTENSNKYSRVLGACLLISSSLVLIKAKSVGAIVSVQLSVIFLYVFFKYQQVNMIFRLRLYINLIIILSVTVFIVFLVYFMSSSFFDELMYSLDKDPTLTGRTYIWDRGLELILNKPVLGLGYQSVFVIKNPVAEDIWEFASVASGAGFNFHNMFINIWVELGLFGLLLYVFGVFSLFLKMLNTYNVQSCYKVISIYSFFFLFIQSFLEAILFNQFTLVHFLICLTWVSFFSVNRSRDHVT
jgi:exopolysaccharide production protein ExoQ